METKLNVLLAKTDHLASSYKKQLEDYVKFFKTNQGAFKGEKKTYTPKPGTIDLPAERGNRLVTTTVDDKLAYLHENTKEYIDSLFSQEKTNSSGIATAKLIVDGQNFGEYTSLELLRLKTLIEHGTLKDMYETLPVRNDDEIWESTKNTMYEGKPIFESELQSGLKKSMMKETYILSDPNISKVDGGKYSPQLASKDTIIELGEYTYQRFSGEITHLERANILARRGRLLTAVIEALKTANEVVAVKSNMTADKLFGYLHTGKI